MKVVISTLTVWSFIVSCNHVVLVILVFDLVVLVDVIDLRIVSVIIRHELSVCFWSEIKLDVVVVYWLGIMVVSVFSVLQ